MKIKANGVEIPVVNGEVYVELAVDAGGEEAPFVSIQAKGGKLDVYRSGVEHSGDISIHLFGKEKAAP